MRIPSAADMKAYFDTLGHPFFYDDNACLADGRWRLERKGGYIYAQSRTELWVAWLKVVQWTLQREDQLGVLIAAYNTGDERLRIAIKAWARDRYSAELNRDSNRPVNELLQGVATHPVDALPRNWRKRIADVEHHYRRGDDSLSLNQRLRLACEQDDTLREARRLSRVLRRAKESDVCCIRL